MSDISAPSTAHDYIVVGSGAGDDEAAQVFKDKDLIRRLIEVSKCPDFVVNKGHYFGTSFSKEATPLSDDDKWALIDFLKTF